MQNRIISLLLFLGITLCGIYAEDIQKESDASPVLHFGGCGGVYFLAEPGDLWVEVEKYDRNIKKRTTYLRAILAGPDRLVLDEATLPDVPEDAQGPIQRIRLSTTVSRKGVYALNITVSEDRYGEDIAWGFRSNCPRYLVETSRGHRDAAHEEPLVLLSPKVPGEVCFRPERDAFSINISGASANGDAPTVCDASGQVIQTLTIDADGKASARIAADVPRDSLPWRLCLPSFQGTVHIDGVTRWPGKCDFPNFSLWTPHAASWFPLHKNRWLLTPYHRKIYAEPGAKGQVVFEVHNNDVVSRTVNLSLEFPDQPWSATLSKETVTAPSGKTTPITLAYALPEAFETLTCYLRVTPQDTPEFSTYATVQLHRGIAPFKESRDLPLVLKPYTHENSQFGYWPEYPTDNQIYFAPNGTPFVAADTALLYWQGNAWQRTDNVIREDGQAGPFKVRSSKVAFDSSNNVYTIGAVDGKPALLYSQDGGVTLKSCVVPGGGGLDIEQFSGHNFPEGPPPLVRCILRERDKKLMWRQLNDLDLLLPEKDAEGNIHFATPIRLSDKCIGFSGHSGIPSSIVSRDGKVHVVWGEATEPDAKAPGVPTFAVTYDRATGQLGEPALLGYGPPANDVHNTPSVTMDSLGYLHVLIGTHGRTFKYVRSLQPNDAGGGWTEPEDIGPGLRQTYVGLVCDKEDTLHVVFRLWFNDNTYFPAGIYATLAYMSKRPGEPWSSPQVLVVSPFSEYSIFYHRLTIDPAGRLFLSYDYWSTYWFYRTDHWGDRRALMMSPDGGASWQLAGMQDLL